MKKMKQNELLRYIAETVLTYEKLEVTRHILWDYMCVCSKILDWFIDGRNTEHLFIAIRKSGLEAGSKEYVKSRLEVLGSPIHTIEISKNEEFTTDYDFEVKEY